MISMNVEVKFDLQLDLTNRKVPCVHVFLRGHEVATLKGCSTMYHPCGSVCPVEVEREAKRILREYEQLTNDIVNDIIDREI